MVIGPRQVRFHRLEKRQNMAIAVAAVLSLVVTSVADFTEVHAPIVPGELSHEETFEGIYGGDFVGGGTDLGHGQWTFFDNGTVQATRIDDDGWVDLLNLLTGGAGSGDDDVWTDGTATITARARYALFPQEFGYDFGAGYVKLFDITGYGFSVSGLRTLRLSGRFTWQWARANNSENGLVNDHYSDESSNFDGLDHMVTYRITGLPGVSEMSRAWLVLWEDLNGPLGDDSDPNNAGIPADRDFNDLAIEIIARYCLTDEDCDDGDPCTSDICNVDGMCEYDDAPAGTACGNPEPQGLCDNPDICDGAGLCIPNYEAEGVECRPTVGLRSWNLEDFGRFQLCFSGTEGRATPDCAVFDYDVDADVDVTDWADFQVTWSGPTGRSAAYGTDRPIHDCDTPEFCTGYSPFCPPDEYLPSTTECRPAAGDCDVGEFCTGTSPHCVPDALVPPGTICREAAGVCDLDESCDGVSPDCPQDHIQPPTVVCRASADLCDKSEFCTGYFVNCPPDTFAPAGTQCRAASGDCDVVESCTGAAPYCPPDVVLPVGSHCRSALDVCDAQEACDGISKACPPDVVRPSGAFCPDDGDECTADVCNGTDITCTHPPNNMCGACCFPDGSCDDEVVAPTCVNLDGRFVGAGSGCLGDVNGDGWDDVCLGDEPVPAASQWGLVVLTLLVLTGSKLLFRERRGGLQCTATHCGTGE